MLSEAKKQLSRNSWHQVQHSTCKGVTIEKFCMGHHNDLSGNNKLPD